METIAIIILSISTGSLLVFMEHFRRSLNTSLSEYGHLLKENNETRRKLRSAESRIDDLSFDKGTNKLHGADFSIEIDPESTTAEMAIHLLQGIVDAQNRHPDKQTKEQQS